MKTRTLAFLATAALLTAACGGTNNSQSASSTAPSTVSPSDMSNNQAPPNRLVIDVNIKGGEVTPANAQLKASIKEQIVIRVNSDVADELHVHSTPDHTFTVEAKPNQSFQFTVDVPGKVDIELHHLNKTVATVAVQ
jgi:ABC-type glycerol-3-phosphate transport system substrate-binding protein